MILSQHSVTKFLMKRSKTEITAGAYLFAAVCVLMLPLNWLIGWLIAVSFHEAGHLAVLRCFSVPVNEIRIGPLGAKISAGHMTLSQEILCAGAGPVCSFLLLLLRRYLPVTALIGLIQGAFNLIPIYPLDGGRMVRSGILLLQEIIETRKIPCKEQNLRVQ